MTVRWSQTGIVQYYRVYISSALISSVTFFGVGSSVVIATVNLLDISSSPGGNSYCMSVTAVSGSVNSSQTTQCSLRTVPAAPDYINFVSSTQHSITIQWNQRGLVDSYNAQVNYIKTLDVGYEGIGTSKVTATFYNLPTAGMKYCMFVTAVSGAIESSTSTFCGGSTQGNNMLPSVIGLGVVAAVFVIATTILTVVLIVKVCRAYQTGKSPAANVTRTTCSDQVITNISGISGEAESTEYELCDTRHGPLYEDLDHNTLSPQHRYDIQYEKLMPATSTAASPRIAMAPPRP
jgi:hypothetical protein